MSCEEITGCVKEDSGFAVLARVQVDGSNWTQAGVSAINWKAWDIADRQNVHASGALTVGNVVFNSLQTDGRWTQDATGYNFRQNTPTHKYSSFHSNRSRVIFYRITSRPPS